MLVWLGTQSVTISNFITTDYPEISPESCKPSVYRGKIQVRADYQQLKDNLTSIDAKVMAEPSSFLGRFCKILLM